MARDIWKERLKKWVYETRKGKQKRKKKSQRQKSELNFHESRSLRKQVNIHHI